MAKTLCKGIRKDGSPCQGRGLPQYDGYCIAHGPPADQAHQWRSLGGQNSSTAARLDKRIPERLKKALDQIEDAMARVLAGTLAPAALTAMCRGAKAKIDLYRLADEDMDTIRLEETEQAAAEIAGIDANLELLEAADDYAARQDQYRSQYLIDLGLAQVENPSRPQEPPQTVLTEEGQRLFGYRYSCNYTQADLDEWAELLDDDDPISPEDMTEYVMELVDMKERTELAQVYAHRVPNPPRDPLTGQTMSLPPACVKASLTSEYDAPGAAPSAEILESRLSQIHQLLQKLQEMHQKKVAELANNPSLAGQAPASDFASRIADNYGAFPQSAPTWP